MLTIAIFVNVYIIIIYYDYVDYKQMCAVLRLRGLEFHSNNEMLKPTQI